MSIGELFRIKRELIREQARVVRTYYPKSLRFALFDLALGACSLFFNPYRICRKRRDVYGETPIGTLAKIAAACQLAPQDVWLELGSGRGKGAAWIATCVGCRAIGVENVPLFARLSRALAFLFRVPAEFRMTDMRRADFSSATCVYLYGTCLSDEAREVLRKKMASLPKGAKIVSISAPLFEEPCDSFPVSFPWGETDAYVHIVGRYGKTVR